MKLTITNLPDCSTRIHLVQRTGAHCYQTEMISTWNEQINCAGGWRNLLCRRILEARYHIRKAIVEES